MVSALLYETFYQLSKLSYTEISAEFIGSFEFSLWAEAFVTLVITSWVVYPCSFEISISNYIGAALEWKVMVSFILINL